MDGGVCRITRPGEHGGAPSPRRTSFPCVTTDGRLPLRLEQRRVFASCGGGAHTGSPLPTASTSAASHAGGASVTLVLTLPARTSSSARRLPKYISAATLGAGVTVTVGGNQVTTAFSLAPNSSSCTTANGSTTCTLNAAASGFGAATIAVALYDQAPAGAVIPASASVLSSGTVGANARRRRSERDASRRAEWNR